MSSKYFAFIIMLSTAAFSTVSAQNHEGTLFHFVPSIGACGFTNTDDEVVASVPKTFFSTFPGATANPNKNPICQKKLLITHGSKDITAQVVDFFVRDDANDVGLSSAGFTQFADLDEGIIPNVQWSVV